jgi:uncharacterized protein (TIGR03546 family)
MLWTIRLIQKLVKALNSEGTPGQVAAGVTLGAALGLTPLASLHNLLFLLGILLLNVSVPGAILGWVAFTGVAFLMDPIFDQVGTAILLEDGALTGVWATIYNTPVLAFTNLTNSIVLGSLIGWLVLALPLFFASRLAIARYRATIYERYKDAPAFRAIRASKLYNAYRAFRP